MDSNKKLMRYHSELFLNPDRYRWLVGKLIYLIITRLDLSYLVGVESIYTKPSHGSLECVIFILRFVGGTLGQSLLYIHQ